MQKLQDSVFTLVKTTNLSPAVFSFLQPTDDSGDKTPLGSILKDTKHGWLALGPKFCVVDLRTGMKVAARTFGATLSNNATVTSVVELPTPLTENSQQLIISLQCDDISIIVVLNINGSQILRCIQTDVVVTQLSICDKAPDGIFTCFDGVVIAGTKRGEIFAFDLNRATLIKALKDISQGYEHLIQNELKPTNLSFLPLESVHRIEEQRELALENDHHLAVLLNEKSFIDSQYIFRNPDGTVRMKAKRDHIRVTALEYITQTGSVAVGFNFGAFQIWNLMTLDLEFTSQVNVECMPVTHFGFQEPCDDPRAFCYLWVIFSVIDRYEEEEFPLAVMYSLTYQGKRMLTDTKCLYQDFTSATIRFQVELSTVNETPLLGGKCVSCHTYSIKSTLGDEGEDNMLNLCQLVWECWAEDTTAPMQYGMLLFDLDQWYKDQMPSTYRVESNAFMSTSSWSEISGGGSVALHVRLDPASVAAYSHATRLEEHFYPNSLQYNCICLNTSEACVLSTSGIQRQIIGSMDSVGPTVLLHPPRLYAACAACGLAPLYGAHCNLTQEDQRRYLLSVALEARLARFLKRCAHDWATGSHSGVGCTLPFLVDWCWKRAIELKENAKELTAPLFISSALPDRNIVRCLEHCVQQLTQLTGLMDAILTKCCNLVVPDALSEMEEKHKGIGTVSLYFQVVQWFLRVGLLPERVDGSEALPYPAMQLYGIYNKRRLKLNRIQDNGNIEENSAHKSCVLLYIDQLLEQEFGGERTHKMWIKGGSECRGLYPPPSLYALLRLYLLPDIAEEHKHSLVLYLLVDYSVIYDDVRYETVIRRLMQFPTMFGLSNTAIKATQAFWHLDHRDFDFALDQLQCLTGNTLSEWQHNVVLSSLLAQKKTQAALQYLHVRKPAPIKNIKDGDYSKVNDHDKLEDWQSCCNLYLARGLVFEAMDVIRMCVQNAGSLSDKTQVLNMFFKGCRNTGNLSKILAVSFLPFEEEVFIKYLEDCNESQTSDILIMYYLQQARYLEAERYNAKLRHTKPKSKDLSTSAESLFEATDRESARDSLVQAMCAALPSIAETVANCTFDQKDVDWHVNAPKPMSVYVQAKSPINRFTYKSSFIQDTIQNASETWVNRPKIRKGLKRMLNIEETPFICTPKLSRSRSIYDQDSTPSKRARLNLTGTPKTPRNAFKVSDKLSSQMEKLLEMPEVHSPVNVYERPETPPSILKPRRNSRTEVPSPSPTCSRYLYDTDDELEMETASNHTHYSDSTNKHLRFTIPTPTELGSEPTPSPVLSRKMPSFELAKERERSVSTEREKEMDISTAESYVTTASHAMNESNPLESPPKKMATEANVAMKKAYKDSVRARQSLSISANSSLSENTSMESIADIPITLINPRYSGNRRARRSQSTESLESEAKEKTENILRYVGARESTPVQREKTEIEREVDRLEMPKTPKGRMGIRASGESTPLRSGSVTPERQDSPALTPLRGSRLSRSRSKTPELSPRSSPLPPILEQPKLEVESEPHSESYTLTMPRALRSRSRTPERIDKGVSESPRLEAIKESPTKSGGDSPSASPRRSLRSRSRTPEVEVIVEPVAKSSPRSLRSRSRTPEVEVIVEPVAKPSPRSLRSRSRTPEVEVIVEPVAKPSPRSLRSRSRTPEVEVIVEPVAKPSSRSLRSRSKTPEKLMSPKREHSVRTKKSLSRLVLEANTFAKTKQTLETLEAESSSECKEAKEIAVEKPREVAIECTPMKPLKQGLSLMDVTLSPIVNKSILQSSNDSVLTESVESEPKDTGITDANLKPLPTFAPLHETYFEKSVLRSYQSTIGDFSQSIEEKEKVVQTSIDIQLPAFTSIQEDFGRSVLHSYESSVAETSGSIQETTPKKVDESKPMDIQTPHAFGSVLHSQSSINESQPQNVSSLITDDSDVEMTEKKEERETKKEEEKETEMKEERETEKEEEREMEKEELETEKEEEREMEKDEKIGTEKKEEKVTGKEEEREPEEEEEREMEKEEEIETEKEDKREAEKEEEREPEKEEEREMEKTEEREMEKEEEIETEKESERETEKEEEREPEKEEEQRKKDNQERAEQKEKEQIVEIEREIHEIEDMSNENESEGESNGETSSKSDNESIDSSNEAINMPSDSNHEAKNNSDESSPAVSHLEKPSLITPEMLQRIMEADFKSTSRENNDDNSSQSENLSSVPSIDEDSSSNDSSQSEQVRSQSESSQSDSSQSDSNQSDSSQSDSSQSDSSQSRQIHSRSDSSQSRQIRSRSDSSQSRQMHSRSDSSQSRQIRSRSDSSQSRQIHSRSDSSQSGQIHSRSDSSQSRQIHSRSDSSQSRQIRFRSDSSQSRQIHSRSDSSQSRQIRSQSDSSQLKKIKTNTDESDDSEPEEKLHVVPSKAAETSKVDPKQVEKQSKDDEISEKMEVTTDPAQIYVMTEDNSVVETEVTPSIEVTNPLDQAQISLMTDDNSTMIEDIEITESIKDPIKSSTDKKEIESQPMEIEKQDEKQKDIEILEKPAPKKNDASETEAVDPLAQVSLMTEDNSGSEQELSLNYSDEKIDIEKDKADLPVTEIQVQDTANPEAMAIDAPASPNSVFIVDTSSSEIEMKDITIEKKTVVVKSQPVQIGLESESVQVTLKANIEEITSKPVQETSKTETTEVTKSESVQKVMKPDLVQVTSKANIEEITSNPVQETSKIETAEVTISESVQKVMKAESIQKSKANTGEITSKPVQETSKTEPTEATKSEAVQKVMKPESVQVSKANTGEITSKPVQETYKTETTEVTKTESVQKVMKPELVQVSKANTGEITSKPVQETSKIEIAEVTISESVQKVMKPESIQVSKANTGEITSKPVQETSKTETAEVTISESVQKVLKPESIQVSKANTGEITSKPVQETSKTETAEVTISESVQKVMKPESIQVSKANTGEITSKPVQETSKTEPTEVTKSESVQKVMKPELVQVTSKANIEEIISKPVQETSKIETAEVTKSESVQKVIKSDLEQVTSKANTEETTSKPVQETSKTEPTEVTKTESVQKVMKPELVQVSIANTGEITSKPVQEASKTEATEVTKSESVQKVMKLELVRVTSKTKTVQKTSKPTQETSKFVNEKSEMIKESTIEMMDTETHTETVIKSAEETQKPEIIQETSKAVLVKESCKPEKVIEKMDTESQIATTSNQETVLQTAFKTDVTATAEKVDSNIESQSSEQESVKQVRSRKRFKSTSSNSEVEPKDIDEPNTPTTRKRAQSRAKSIEIELQLQKATETEPTPSTSEIEPKTPVTRKRAQSRAKSIEMETPKESNEPIDKPKAATRKRTIKSSKTDELPIVSEEPSQTDEVDEPKTPTIRKRAISSQSEESTPETSWRIKTPSSTEIRTIITRRMSRELDESNRSLDEPVVVTPKLRNARKLSDDNESVASESSMASSVQNVEGKKRGRKSTVATKPDLSVIPEMEQSLDPYNEYSGTRRLTRYQKAILDTSRGRRQSKTSRASRSSMSEQDEEERRPAFDLQPIDRISLLNKESYDGPPDEDELQLRSMSPESIASDASRMRSRMARADSEAKVVVKAAKIHRRITSVDDAESSPMSSPVQSGTESPARSRRASFNRAVEALLTPKGRRQSTDSRKSDISSVGSPSTSEADGLSTPARRGRRRTSTLSNTSQTGRARSKKMPILEDIEETKK